MDLEISDETYAEFALASVVQFATLELVAHAVVSAYRGPEQIQQEWSSRSGQGGLPVARNPDANLISVEAERRKGNGSRREGFRL